MGLVGKNDFFAKKINNTVYSVNAGPGGNTCRQFDVATDEEEIDCTDDTKNKYPGIAGITDAKSCKLACFDPAQPASLKDCKAFSYVALHVSTYFVLVFCLIDR